MVKWMLFVMMVKIKEIITLNNPDEALFIPEMIWDEQVYYDKKTLLLVIANTNYNKDDYIENYQEFLKLRGIS